jgi:ketosteroid isomerase-like protein
MEIAMRSSLLVVPALVIALSSASGCTGDGRVDPASAGRSGAVSFDLAAARKVIEENNERFTRAHVTGDSVLIDTMFTQDARVLPPGAGPVIGRTAIAGLTRQYIESGVTEFREATTDFYGNEELLIDQGSYVMVYGREKTVERGKYLNVWKKEGGTWKIYSNIWNTDR